MSDINAEVVAALKHLRTHRTGLYMAHLTQDAFRTLDQAGVFDEIDRWEELNGWIPLPDGVTGVQIRHRKIVDNRVRYGGGEPKVIVAETAEWVIYAVFSGPGPGTTGRFIKEIAAPRDRFEEEFERKE